MHDAEGRKGGNVSGVYDTKRENNTTRTDLELQRLQGVASVSEQREGGRRTAEKVGADARWSGGILCWVISGEK